jgi:tRNA pseudouridine38-40 synthase
MPRIAMGIQYKGTDYVGWQFQPGLKTVQQTVESAISRVANEPISVVCAGRTDSGVHALGQVIHFDTTASRELEAWHRGSNAFLPADVAVNWVRLVTDQFHARFSAQSREYRYVLYNHESRPALMADFVKWESRPLDLESMQAAGQYLLGEHDFSSFRGSGCQAKTAIRTVYSLEVKRHGLMVSLDIKANAFLLHMVRNIVGSLLRVGVGLEPVEWMKTVLDLCDRRKAGMTISPAGLSLTQVNYEMQLGFPSFSMIMRESPLWVL